MTSAQPRLSRTIPSAVYMLALMWALYAIDFLLLNISYWGIYPRSIQGLLGIISAPWLHHSLYHLISNSVPFVILGTLVQWQNPGNFWRITILIIIGGGIGTWLFGSAGNHLGASGLVFGYWAYLITSAYYQRTFKAIAVAVITILLYGGLLFGLLDLRTHISWTGHIFGMIAGFFAAKWCVSHAR